jgi:hypothetical protein
MEVNTRPYPQESIYVSSQGGRERVFVTKFTLKMGLYPQVFKSELIPGCWRGLLLDELEDDDTWLVHESLYYSDTLSKDGLWINRSGIDLHKMPNALTFRSSLEDVKHVPTQRANKDAPAWYNLPYEVILMRDGYLVTFKIVSQRRGRSQEPETDCADVIYKDAHYDTVGMSQLFSSARW